MKQTLILSCILAIFTAIGCTQQALPPTEVTVALDYSFMESGSMTKAGDAVYSDFYEKYVKSKVLTPKTFNLTFTNVETKAVATIKGDWTKNHSLKLLTGDYEVTGTSYPAYKDKRDGDFKGIDSLFICFNETVKITSEMTKLNLTAQYDSYLLMFDKSDKSLINYRYHPTGSNSYYDIALKDIDDIYYAFYNKLNGYDKENQIIINRTVGTTTINMINVPFEKGHYYYFNDLSNSFDIPPMTSGN